MKTLICFASVSLFLSPLSTAAATFGVDEGAAAVAAQRGAELETPPIQLGERLIRWSTLEGTSVAAGRSASDERPARLAEFADLILDPLTGSARYALLERGGVAAAGGNTIAVPLEHLRLEAQLDDNDELKFELSARLTPEQVAAAPAFDAAAWAAGDTAWEAGVQRFYATLDAPVAEGEPVPERGATQEAGAPAEEEQPAPQPLARLSEIGQAALLDADGARLASIQELVLDPSNFTVAYAVIGSGGGLDLGGEYRALPMAAMQAERDETGSLRCMTSLAPMAIEAAAVADMNDWEFQGTRSFAERVKSQLDAGRSEG